MVVVPLAMATQIPGRACGTCGHAAQARQVRTPACAKHVGQTGLNSGAPCTHPELAGDGVEADGAGLRLAAGPGRSCSFLSSFVSFRPSFRIIAGSSLSRARQYSRGFFKPLLWLAGWRVAGSAGLVDAACLRLCCRACRHRLPCAAALPTWRLIWSWNAPCCKGVLKGGRKQLWQGSCTGFCACTTWIWLAGPIWRLVWHLAVVWLLAVRADVLHMRCAVRSGCTTQGILAWACLAHIGKMCISFELGFDAGLLSGG